MKVALPSFLARISNVTHVVIVWGRRALLAVEACMPAHVPLDAPQLVPSSAPFRMLVFPGTLGTPSLIMKHLYGGGTPVLLVDVSNMRLEELSLLCVVDGAKRRAWSFNVPFWHHLFTRIDETSDLTPLYQMMPRGGNEGVFRGLIDASRMDEHSDLCFGCFESGGTLSFDGCGHARCFQCNVCYHFSHRQTPGPQAEEAGTPSCANHECPSDAGEPTPFACMACHEAWYCSDECRSFAAPIHLWVCASGGDE